MKTHRHHCSLRQLLTITCLLVGLSLYLAQRWLAQPLYASQQQGVAAAPGLGAADSCFTPLDQWERHLLDANRPERAVFVNFADLDGDGVEDVITGGFWYRNVRSITGPWVRQAIGAPYTDTLAVYDFDGDGDADLLGTAGAQNKLPFVWARNDGSGHFTVFDNIDSELTPPDRLPIQGVAIARFQPDGPLEVALAWDDNFGGLQMLTVPTDPAATPWPRRQAAPFTQGEALSPADLDGDGDIDIFTGSAWLRNEWPAAHWTPIIIHTPTSGVPDRHQLVDMDQDGDLDAVVGYGHDPEAKVVWYEQPASPTEPWAAHLIANLPPRRGSPQNLDVADLDHDGDLDVVTAHHRQRYTTVLQAFVLENVDGLGRVWEQHLIHTGDEHHDGMQLLDVEGDGDLDIISIGWTHGMVILYENKGHPPCPTATPTLVPVTATATPMVVPATPTTALAVPTTASGGTPTSTPQRALNAPLYLPFVNR